MPDHSAAATSDEPVLIFQGGVDELQLEPGGKVYHPGDPMPKSLSHLRRISAEKGGARFEMRHPEPVLMPDGKPAEMAAAEQIDPPAGSPAIVAAIEDDVDAVDIRAPQGTKADDDVDAVDSRGPQGQPASRASRRS